jgi:choline dehydrogenase-like flavoprotein
LIAHRQQEFDVVIVGSGAGGGIASHVLTEAGARVCVLEKGPWLHPENYGDDELRFGDRNFIEEDPLIEPRTFRNSPEDGDHQVVGRVLGISRCVGGGTVHYGAVSFRFRPADFNARSYWGPLPGAEIVNWPLSYEDLRPYYGQVENLIGVAGGQLRGDRHPGAPVPGAEWRSESYPMPGHPPNYGAKLFEDATARLGLHPFPTPVAINNLGRDGRAGCSYCGFCSSHGCPIEAKNDMRVTALRRALATGRLEIRPDSYVYRVAVDRRGRAESVEYIDSRGRRRSVRGKVIVLACSTVDTPRLVLLSELPQHLVNFDVVGRHLMVHHYPGGIGFFSDRIDYYRGYWSMRCLDDWYLGPEAGAPAFGYGNLQTVGPSSGYPFGAGGMISTAKFAGWGANHKTAMGATFGHVQWLTMVGQDPPVPTNMVDLDPTVRDAYGFPVSRITYQHHPNDYQVEADVAPRLSQILTEMGAESTQSVVPVGATTSIPEPGPGGSGQRGPGRSAPDPIAGLVNHQMGTMRMGDDPDTSVVNGDQRFHGIPNLYVIDGSVLPTAGGYNPTLTIQALAWRAAERLAQRIGPRGAGSRAPKQRSSARTPAAVT